MLYGAVGENALASEQEASAATSYSISPGITALGAMALGQQSSVNSSGLVEAVFSAAGAGVATFVGTSTVSGVMTAAGVGTLSFAAVITVHLLKTITQSQTINRRVLVNHSTSAITTNNVVVNRILSYYRTIAANSPLVAAVIKGTNKTFAVSYGSIVRLVRAPGKVVAVTLAQTIAYTLFISHITLVTMTSVISSVRAMSIKRSATLSQSVVVSRLVRKIIAVTLVQIVVFGRIASYLRTISVTQTMTVVARKTVLKRILTSSGLVVSTSRGVQKIVAATLGQIVNRAHMLGLVTHAVSSLSALAVSVVRPSALRHWPSGVSSAFIVDGYMEELENNVNQFTPEIGMPKIRRKGSNSTETLTGSIIMTGTEYLSFVDFFRNTIHDGVDPFNMTHPRTQATTRLRFLEAPSIVDYGPDQWKVSVKMRRDESSIVRPTIPASTLYEVEPRTDALGSMAMGQQGTVRSL